MNSVQANESRSSGASWIMKTTPIEEDYKFMNEDDKWAPLHGNQNSAAINGRKWTNKIRIKRLKVNVRRFVLTRFDVLYFSRSLFFLVYLNKVWVSLHYQGLFICSRVIRRMSKEQWNNSLFSSGLTDHPTRPSLLIARRSDCQRHRRYCRLDSYLVIITTLRIISLPRVHIVQVRHINLRYGTSSVIRLQCNISFSSN